MGDEGVGEVINQGLEDYYFKYFHHKGGNYSREAMYRGWDGYYLRK